MVVVGAVRWVLVWVLVWWVWVMDYRGCGKDWCEEECLFTYPH